MNNIILIGGGGHAYSCIDVIEAERKFKIIGLIDNKLIDGNVKKTQQDLEYEDFLFNKYLRDIENNMVKERRYIEFPNPSEEVIKKFPSTCAL